MRQRHASKSRTAIASARVVTGSVINNSHSTVFPSPKNPECHLHGDLNLWYRIRRAIGIDDVRLHDLRYSCAGQCVMAGVPLPVVSRLLGHSPCSMTLRYAYVSDTDVAHAAERIGTRMHVFLQGE